MSEERKKKATEMEGRTAQGKFKKGVSGNLGGTSSGQKTIARELRNTIYRENYPQIAALYKKLLDFKQKSINGEKITIDHRLSAASKLLDKIMPNLKAMEIENKGEGRVAIVINMPEETAKPTYQSDGKQQRILEIQQ